MAFNENDFWAFFHHENKECLIHVWLGTGDNLLKEDYQEGYTWYNNVDLFEGILTEEQLRSVLIRGGDPEEDIPELINKDGGMILYKEDDVITVDRLFKDALRQFFDEIGTIGLLIVDDKGEEYGFPLVDVGLNK